MENQLLVTKVLEEKHASEVILFLHFFGSRSRSDIYRAVSTNPRMGQKMDKLENMGIVCSTKSSANKRTVALTPLGEKYAKALCSLEAASGGNMDGYKWDVMRSMMPGRDED